MDRALPAVAPDLHATVTAYDMAHRRCAASPMRVWAAFHAMPLGCQGAKGTTLTRPVYTQHQSMTEDDFYQLIKQPEGNTLDYKRAWYDLSKTHRFKFIKDVLAMANTPREDPARIVMGVDWSAESGSTVVGLDEQPDDANLQEIFPRERIQPAPAFHYHPLRFLGKQVGILEIPIGGDGPCMPLDDLEKVGNVYKLQKGAIYYRNGSQNDQAVGSDLDRIYRWFIKLRSNVGQSSKSDLQVASSTLGRAPGAAHSPHESP